MDKTHIDLVEYKKYSLHSSEFPKRIAKFYTN